MDDITSQWLADQLMALQALHTQGMDVLEVALDLVQAHQPEA